MMQYEQMVALGPQIDQLRRTYAHQLSSHAFLSLCLWAEDMGLAPYVTQDFFTSPIGFLGEDAWMFPCGAPAAIKQFIQQRMKAPFSLHYLRQQDVRWLSEQFPNDFAYIPTPDNDEYIYSIPEQIQLQGKAYAKLRTQINKVKREYSPRFQWLSAQNMDDAHYVLAQWKATVTPKQTSFFNDDAVVNFALAHRQELGIEGILVYVEDVPVALTAGFPLTNDTFDILIAKTVDHRQGLSYYAKYILMEQLSDGYQWINMEEDLGLLGLRTMKTMMNPSRKNTTWKAVLL